MIVKLPNSQTGQTTCTVHKLGSLKIAQSQTEYFILASRQDIFGQLFGVYIT